MKRIVVIFLFLLAGLNAFGQKDFRSVYLVDRIEVFTVDGKINEGGLTNEKLKKLQAAKYVDITDFSSLSGFVKFYDSERKELCGANVYNPLFLTYKDKWHQYLETNPYSGGEMWSSWQEDMVWLLSSENLEAMRNQSVKTSEMKIVKQYEDTNEGVLFVLRLPSIRYLQGNNKLQTEQEVALELELALEEAEKAGDEAEEKVREVLEAWAKMEAEAKAKLEAEEANIEDDDEIYAFEEVEVPPRYPGGMEAFMQYVASHFGHLEVEINMLRFLIKFVIGRNGYLADIQVLRDGGFPDAAKRVVRILEECPRWKPGLINGKPVNVSYVTPVVIKE